jgi:LemA protein
MSSKTALIVVVVVAVLWGWWGYNKMVGSNEIVTQKWSDVESQYQRRSDLIPNLAKTVKSYADFEQETLTKVIEARAKATQVTINPGELTTENMAKFQAAQAELSSSLGRLMLVVERYPDLKANQSYLDFQRELAGTENRITVARKDYNEVVTPFNVRVKKFPMVILSRAFGFDSRPFYEADQGAEKAPDVSDDL